MLLKRNAKDLSVRRFCFNSNNSISSSNYSSNNKQLLLCREFQALKMNPEGELTPTMASHHQIVKKALFHLQSLTQFHNRHHKIYNKHKHKDQSPYQKQQLSYSLRSHYLKRGSFYRL